MNQGEKMFNADETPLYQRNPLGRFSHRASNYAKYRPSYPAAAIDVILEGLGMRSQLIAADIGAGTGISARLLAQRGVKVVAIEPNADMRQAATPHPLVEYREATAEATGLADASVALVTCFQSFHWFNPEPTLQEFQRILKPTGKIALVFNDLDEEDEFSAEYVRLVMKASDKISKEKLHTFRNSISTHPDLVNIQNHTFAYRQEVDLNTLLGHTRSSSFMPQEGEAYQQLMSDLQQLHAQFCNERGIASLIYTTSVFLAELRPMSNIVT